VDNSRHWSILIIDKMKQTCNLNLEVLTNNVAYFQQPITIIRQQCHDTFLEEKFTQVYSPIMILGWLEQSDFQKSQRM
jgi:uncharacterized protein (DUF1919 family)